MVCSQFWITEFILVFSNRQPEHSHIAQIADFCHSPVDMHVYRTNVHMQAYAAVSTHIDRGMA